MSNKPSISFIVVLWELFGLTHQLDGCDVGCLVGITGPTGAGETGPIEEPSPSQSAILFHHREESARL